MLVQNRLTEFTELAVENQMVVVGDCVVFGTFVSFGAFGTLKLGWLAGQKGHESLCLPVQSVHSAGSEWA